MPENPANEYDIAGQIHNAALAQFMSNPDNQVAFKENWVDYTGNLLAENGYSKENFDAVMTNANANELLGTLNPFGLNEVTPSLLENLSTVGAISPELKDFYTNINGCINNLAKDGNYNNFKAAMIRLEATADRMNDDDRGIALSAASIARYSFAYWMNNDPTGGMAMPMGWGKADFAGAVGGGARFIIAAAFGGPVGWGGWAGAVIGSGVGASIGYAIGSH